MSLPPDEQLISKLSSLYADLYTLSGWYRSSDGLVLSLNNLHEPDHSTKLLAKRLKLTGYQFKTNQSSDLLLLTITGRKRFTIPRLNVLLFCLTLITVYVFPVFRPNLSLVPIAAVPASLQNPEGILQNLQLYKFVILYAWNETCNDLANGVGLEFTIAIISILFVHEMGHYIAGRRRGIASSWPYFLPAPNLIGTFGAIIRTVSPFWNRRDLLEVGAAGPIAGWIVAIGWLVWGLSHSAIVSPELANPKMMVFSLEGESLLMRTLVNATMGPATLGNFYQLSEAAFAGWVGMLITAINMLPIGQLDGGHVTYALFGRRQHLLGYVAMGLLIFLGFLSPIWWVFAAMSLIFGIKHPPTMSDQTPLSNSARVMGILALVIFAISFTPIPFR